MPLKLDLIVYVIWPMKIYISIIKHKSANKPFCWVPISCLCKSIWGVDSICCNRVIVKTAVTANLIWNETWKSQGWMICRIFANNRETRYGPFCQWRIAKSITNNKILYPGVHLKLLTFFSWVHFSLMIILFNHIFMKYVASSWKYNYPSASEHVHLIVMFTNVRLINSSCYKVLILIIKTIVGLHESDIRAISYLLFFSISVFCLRMWRGSLEHQTDEHVSISIWRR